MSGCWTTLLSRIGCTVSTNIDDMDRTTVRCLLKYCIRYCLLDRFHSCYRVLRLAAYVQPLDQSTSQRPTPSLFLTYHIHRAGLPSAYDLNTHFKKMLLLVSRSVHLILLLVAVSTYTQAGLLPKPRQTGHLSRLKRGSSSSSMLPWTCKQDSECSEQSHNLDYR